MEAAPIEHLALSLPPHLDGHDGRYRLPIAYKTIPANTDIEAIMAWLSNHRSPDSTFRRYRSAANQLLNWSLIELNKPISSLENEDIQLYCNFLRNPVPPEQWISSRITYDPAQWRPFKGQLSSATIHNTLATLQSLMIFLRTSGYCDVWSSLYYRRRQGLFMGVRPSQMPGDLMWESNWDELNRHLKKLSTPDELLARLALQLIFYCCLEAPVIVGLDETAFKREGNGYLLTINDDRYFYLAPPIVETLNLLAKAEMLSATFGIGQGKERKIFDFCSMTLRRRVRAILSTETGRWQDLPCGVPSLCSIKKWGKAHAAKYGDKMWHLIGVGVACRNYYESYLPERRKLSAQEVESLYSSIGL